MTLMENLQIFWKTGRAIALPPPYAPPTPYGSVSTLKETRIQSTSVFPRVALMIKTCEILVSRNLYFSECIRTNLDQFDTLYNTVKCTNFFILYGWIEFHNLSDKRQNSLTICSWLNDFPEYAADSLFTFN